MLVAKQVADLLTIGRALIGFGLAFLGVIYGATGLAVAVWLMILSWTTDSLDGTFARRSRRQYQTWIGEHDLQIDIFVSIGLLVYLLASGLVNRWLAVAYFLSVALVYWYMGFPRSLGMLIQAPVYGWFIWVALREAPKVGRWMLVWIVVAVIITWPRFPKEIVPDFVGGMRSLLVRNKDTGGE